MQLSFALNKIYYNFACRAQLNETLKHKLLYVHKCAPPHTEQVQFKNQMTSNQCNTYAHSPSIFTPTPICLCSDIRGLGCVGRGLLPHLSSFFPQVGETVYCVDTELTHMPPPPVKAVCVTLRRPLFQTWWKMLEQTWSQREENKFPVRWRNTFLWVALQWSWYTPSAWLTTHRQAQLQ